VDVLQSISRLANVVVGPHVREACGVVRRLLATYYGSEDLISVGAYVKGSNAEIDESIDKFPAIEKFLIQRIEEKAPLSETLRMVGEIAGVEIPEEELAQDATVPVQA
jgi:flagellum-specific ATP synthase